MLKPIISFISLFFNTLPFGSEPLNPEEAVPVKFTSRRKEAANRIRTAMGKDPITAPTFEEKQAVEKQKADLAAEAAKQKELEENAGKSADELEAERIKAEAAKNDKPEAPAKEEGKVYIGEEEVAPEEFEKVYALATEGTTEEEFEKLDEKVQEFLIQKAYNLRKGSKSIDRKHQDLANEKKTFDKTKTDAEQEIEAEKQRLVTAENEMLEKFRAEDARLKEIKKELEAAQAAIDVEVDEDDMSQKEISAIEAERVQAKRDKKELEKEQKLKENTIRLMAEEGAQNYKFALITGLQQKYPEIRTTQTFEKLFRNKYIGADKTDKVKAFRALGIVEKWLNQSEDFQKDMPLEEYYEIERENLPAITETKKQDNKKPENPHLKKQIEKWSKRQSTPNAPNGQAGPGSTVNPKTGEKQRERSEWRKKLQASIRGEEVK